MAKGGRGAAQCVELNERDNQPRALCDGRKLDWQEHRIKNGDAESLTPLGMCIDCWEKQERRLPPNYNIPIGTTVDLELDFGMGRMRTRTRSRPWRVCGHWSVLLEGKSGGWLLERVHTDLVEMPPAYATYGATNVDGDGREVFNG